MVACLLFALAPILPARAQVLPGGMPALPRVPASAPIDTLDGALSDPAGDVLGTVRIYRQQAEALLREARPQVARAPDGAIMRRAEYLALDIDTADLDAIRAAGFRIVREDRDDELGLSISLLRDSRDRSPGRALRALRAALPGRTIEPHHLFLPAGGPASQAHESASADAGLRVGLVDGGVDATAPALARTRIVSHGCDGRSLPQPHGTRVAMRLVAGAPATLLAADLWCGQRVGGDTLALVEALRWMAQQRVAVINISLVGPDNTALRRTVEALLARGQVIVAAAGNDGPAAPPRFPAGYPGVVAVAAVNARGGLLPESAVGKHVSVCADGVVDARTRGTSFAAPVVAHILAGVWTAPAPGHSAEAMRVLARAARPARTSRCGLGIIAPT
ncbi:S8 family serine peptidase [Thermomonas fusca]|uniref:S8 family serine peptidase n=1 Tax=Thermomonas fusca TaxID=215690 RepID=UPI000424C6CD|nr:S8 family serine peptidase [Thermomonas fusca]